MSGKPSRQEIFLLPNIICVQWEPAPTNSPILKKTAKEIFFPTISQPTKIISANKPYIGTMTILISISTRIRLFEAYNNKQIFGMSYVSPAKLARCQKQKKQRISISVSHSPLLRRFFQSAEKQSSCEQGCEKSLSLATDRQGYHQ